MRAENFQHAVLLREERPGLDVLEETPFALPAHDTLQKLISNAPCAEVAKLDDDDLRLRAALAGCAAKNDERQRNARVMRDLDRQ